MTCTYVHTSIGLTQAHPKFLPNTLIKLLKQVLHNINLLNDYVCGYICVV